MDQTASGIGKAIIRRGAQVLSFLFLQAAVFFLAAGSPDFPRAWLYFSIYLVYLAVNMAVFLKWNPDIIGARSETKLVKSWDVAFGIVYTLSMVLTPAIAGLDVGRFHWSVLDARFAALGILLFVPGAVLITWAMAVNKFFEGTVRIQKDRGQKVISAGPYAYVRHPGYAGMSLIYIAPPLILGSAYALIPAAAIVVGLVVRTHFEDRMLQEELDGYAAYAKKVRYRLVPGIW